MHCFCFVSLSFLLRFLSLRSSQFFVVVVVFAILLLVLFFLSLPFSLLVVFVFSKNELIAFEVQMICVLSYLFVCEFILCVMVVD